MTEVAVRPVEGQTEWSEPVTGFDQKEEAPLPLEGVPVPIKIETSNPQERQEDDPAKSLTGKLVTLAGKAAASLGAKLGRYENSQASTLKKLTGELRNLESRNFEDSDFIEGHAHELDTLRFKMEELGRLIAEKEEEQRIIQQRVDGRAEIISRLEQEHSLLSTAVPIKVEGE